MFCVFNVIEEEKGLAVEEKAKEDTTIKDLEKIIGIEEVTWRPRTLWLKEEDRRMKFFH